ncbi:unnamed protein product [Tilletia controversa]|nr:unnamed protein product [Tilletia controversa]CAD6985764.1 unnamed protein product [Tilletia controversa]
MSVLNSRILATAARATASAVAARAPTALTTLARRQAASPSRSLSTSRTRPNTRCTSATPLIPTGSGSASFCSAAVRPGASGSHGGGKLKTHMGTKKRFFPVGSIVGMFKRGRAGKSHLNSHMSSVRRSRLRGMAITPPGQTARHLKRLLGPIL